MRSESENSACIICGGVVKVASGQPSVVGPD
jgi:hypothetical protein